jgi:hypothetical protein
VSFPVRKFTFTPLPFLGRIFAMKDKDDKSSEATPFDRFRSLVSKIVKVPKKEVDRKEAAYQRKRVKKRGEK